MQYNEDKELCASAWRSGGSDGMILDQAWAKSELVERPQFNVLTAGNREGPQPFNLVLNWAKATWKDSGNAQYSKFRFDLKRPISGYRRVSCISIAVTNVFSNLFPFYVGMRIEELGSKPYVTLGNGGVFDQLGGTTSENTVPTFLISTAASYSPLVGTGSPADLRINQGIITGKESYYGEYSVDVAGQTFDNLTVTLTDGDFKRLTYGAMNFTPALFAFQATLRFE